MMVLQAAAWGVAGGMAAGVASLMTVIVKAGFDWPDRTELGPRLFVFAGTLLLGALVAAAMHSSMNGPWPAFVMGVGAPATVRGLLAGVQVNTPARSPAAPPPSPPGPVEATHARQEEGAGDGGR